jgi:opacity protein-like surface antigen
MKKILSIAAIAALFAGAANAADTDKYVKLGANAGEVKALSTTVDATSAEIGFGANMLWDNGFTLGFDTNFDYADYGESTSNVITTFAVDLKPGYTYKDITVFGIASAGMQGVESTDQTGYGFGYGAGIEYKALDWLAVAAEHKQYTFTTETHDYDYTKSGAYLKILF